MKELGLRLIPEGRDLGLYVLETGERQLKLDELHDSLDETDQQLEELQAELARLKASRCGPSA